MSENYQAETSNSEGPPRIRIMIVEDEPDIGVILKQLLGSQYDVVHASNGLEALDRLNWYEPDLTIMDLMMPILNGIDTTRAIKKDNDFMTMPVLFLTARKDNQSVREALMAGGDLYLEKPFDPRELSQRVQEMITRNQVRPRPKKYTMEDIRAQFDVAPKPPAPVPLADPSTMSLTEQLARAAAAPKARVAAVYDSQETLKTMQKGLRNHFEFIGVRDAEAAIDKISAYQPDILILSARGTSISGFLMAHLLRVNRQFRVPSIALLYEEENHEEQQQAERLGIKTVNWVPGDPEPILIMLREVTSAPGFTRVRKRLDYREILRREEPEEDEL